MKTIQRLLRRAPSDERGAGLVEYALLVALVAVVCIGAVSFLGSSESDELDKAGTAIAGGADGQQCITNESGTEHAFYDVDEETGMPINVSLSPGPCP